MRTGTAPIRLHPPPFPADREKGSERRLKTVQDAAAQAGRGLHVMSAESKKLVWLSVAVVAFALVLAGAGLILFAPKKGGGSAPATVGNVAPPKAADPQDYLLAPPPAPSLETPRSSAGDIIVIYGENPPAGSATAPAGMPAAAGQTTAAQTAGGSTAGPVAAGPVAAGPSPAAPTHAGSGVLATQQRPAKSAAAGPSPAAARSATKTRTKASAPKTVIVDEYWIQVASFSSRGRADELKTSLAARGLASLITTKEVSGKTYYRVRIGPYAARAEADGWLAKLRGLPGCEEAVVWTTRVEKTR